jgi:hypothetical protein
LKLENVIIATNYPYSAEKLNPNVLGIRCGKPQTVCEKAAKINEDILAPKPKNITDLITKMLDTFMYPMEQGQIRSDNEKKQTVELPTSKYAGIKTDKQIQQEIEDILKGIKFEDNSPNAKRIKKLEEVSVELIDFAAGITDEFRGNIKLANAKKMLIDEAYKITKEKLNMFNL